MFRVQELMRAALFLTSIFIACCVHADEEQRGEIPPELVERLKVVMKTISPQCQFSSDEYYIEWRLRCQDFLAHSRDMSGRINSRSHASVGPQIDGFRVRFSWSETGGESSQWGGWGSTINRSYWVDYPNYYRLRNADGYVYMNVSFGSRTDMTVLTTLQKELSRYGQQMYGPATMFRKPQDDWDEKSTLLLTDLKKVLKAHLPDTKWRRDGKSLIGEYNTTVYDIHAIDESGNIAGEAHQETGPLHDGLIVQITPLKSSTSSNSSPVFGRISTRYWQHFYVVYRPFFRTPIRLDLKYGRRTSLDAIQATIAAIEKRLNVRKIQSSDFGVR